MAKRKVVIIEKYKTRSGTQPHRFRIKGANGEPMGPSEGYATTGNRNRAANAWAKLYEASGYTVKWVDLTKKKK